MVDYIRTGDGFVEVYTDGACPNNGQNGASAGIGVWWNHDHPLNISQRVEGYKHSNNVAETQAAAIAVGLAIDEGISSLQINTDSQYLINCMTEWIFKWKRNNFRTCQGKEVENKMELEELDRLCQGLKIRWNYVPVGKILCVHHSLLFIF